MEQYAMIQMLVEQAAVPALRQKETCEIVLRQANAKYQPFIKAILGGNGEKAVDKIFGETKAFDLVDVRSALRNTNRDIKSLSLTCKNMSVQVDQIYKSVKSVQSLAYLNTGLGLANIAVNVAGFVMVSNKLNILSSEVQRMSSRLNQVVTLMKHEIIGKFQRLTMLYNQMAAKLDSNEQIDLDELERLIIEMRSFLSEMVLNLNEKALQEEVLLEIVYTLIPAYTSLLCEFVKSYYFMKQNNSPNYQMFLNLYNELEESHFRQCLFDYYMLNKKLNNIDVIDILNAQSLIGINGRVQVEDQLSLVQVLGTVNKLNEFECQVDAFVKEQVQQAAGMT